MADWEARRAHYKEIMRRDDQSHEDMIARRIVRGLGYANAEKVMYALERSVLGTTHGTSPMWVRATAVFEAAVATNARNKSNALAKLRNWKMEARQIKDNAEAAERFEDWWMYDRLKPGVTYLPLMFVQIKGTAECRVYSLWLPEYLALLTPPYTVLEFKAATYRLVVQDVTVFVSQFGPYPGLIHDDTG